MKAFTNTIETKQQAVKNAKMHRKLDMLISGTYAKGEGENFKACSVGCTYKPFEGWVAAPNLHALSEPVHGIPEWLTRVRDTVFEGLPKDKRDNWHVDFNVAINKGADLDKIKGKYLVFVLGLTLTTFDHKAFPQVKAAIDMSITLWKRKDVGSESFKKAAYAAADAAAGAAADAAGAAAYAAGAAAYAARAAARAADAAAYAARAAAYAADAADAARAADAADAARAAHTKIAKELIKLIKGCK